MSSKAPRRAGSRSAPLIRKYVRKVGLVYVFCDVERHVAELRRSSRALCSQGLSTVPPAKKCILHLPVAICRGRSPFRKLYLLRKVLGANQRPVHLKAGHFFWQVTIGTFISEYTDLPQYYVIHTVILGVGDAIQSISISIPWILIGFFPLCQPLVFGKESQ